MPTGLSAERQIEVRCAECEHRLLDYVNEIRSGRVLLEIKCPWCRKMHVQIVGELRG